MELKSTQKAKKRRAAYSESRELISEMQEIPAGLDFYLNRQIAEKSKKVLNFLENHLRIEAPQILNEDGDELIFTWFFKNYECSLAIAEDEIAFTTLHLPTMKTKTEVITQGSKLKLGELTNFFKNLS